MKKNFRIIAAVMTAAVLMAFTGCSSSNSSSGSASSQSSGETSSQTASASGETSSEQITVGILQLSEHDALDKCRQGFLDYLAENGYTDGENIVFDYQNAQGDQSNLKTISQQFVNNGYDYLVGISTPATQSLDTETQEIPVIGTALLKAMRSRAEMFQALMMKHLLPTKWHFLKKLFLMLKQWELCITQAK